MPRLARHAVIGFAFASVLVLLLTPGRAIALDLQAAPAIGGPLQIDREAPPGATEVPELRTRDTKTYITDADEYVTRFYEGSVHYKDRSGNWKPIENNLVATFTPGYAYKNKANRYVAEFPPDVAQPVRFSRGDDNVTLMLRGAEGSSSVDGTTARYPDAMPGVSVEYQPLNDALKESLILSSASTPDRFRFFVRTSEGLTAKERKAGGVDFVKSGEVEFSLAAPSMHDSSSPQSTLSEDVELTLEKVADGYDVTLVPDRSWLESKQRVWPVTIDPSLFVRSDTECTTFASGDTWETTRRCKDPNYSTVTAGADNASSPQRARSLFKFNVGDIPADAQVTSATFGLKLLWAQRADQALTLHRVQNDWTHHVNWRTRDGSDVWGTAGGDIDAALGNGSTVDQQTGTVTWSDAGLIALVQHWVDRSLPNTGMLLRTVEESGTVGNLHYFWGSSSFLSQYWPYLDVKWKPQGRYSSTPANSWTVDGGTGGAPSVEAIESTDDKLYIGGDFSAVGPRTGAFTTFGTFNKKYQPAMAEVAGVAAAATGGSVPVRAIAPDGSGGWYIGGDFKYVGGRAVQHLAHVRSDGSLDESWTPDPDGRVYALTVNQGDLFVGGDFWRIGGRSRRGLAKLNATTGAVDLYWVAGANGATKAIVLANTGSMYIGGDFTSLQNGATPRERLAALDPADGSPRSLNLPVDKTVTALAAYGSQLYIGGQFTTVGGAARQHLARIETSTNLLDGSWTPNPDGAVDGLLVDGTRLYVGGNFARIAGDDRNGIGAFDLSSGNLLTSWDPNPGSAAAGSRVRAIRVLGSTLFVGGEFSTMGGQPRANLASLVTSTGSARAWNPAVGSAVHALALCTGALCYGGSDRIAAGGRFRSANASEHKNLAQLNPATGEPTEWNPSPDKPVKTLELARGALYVGGSYTSFEKGGPGGSSATRKGLAYFVEKTGELAPWTAQPCDSQATSAEVEALGATATTLYVGAPCFTNNVDQRSGLAGFSLDSGQLKTSFNPNVNGIVNELETDGDYVFFAGGFTTAGGQPRSGLASLSEKNGLTGWIPEPDGPVSDIAVANGKIYVVGDFEYIAGQRQPEIAAFPNVNGDGGLDGAWRPTATGDVEAIDADGTGVYIGGSFSAVGGVPRAGLAALSLSIGAPLPLNPYVAGAPPAGGQLAGEGVRAIDITDQRLNVGGDWHGIGSRAQTGFASFPSYGYVAEPREGERTRKRLTLRAATQVSLFNSVRFEFRPPTASGQPLQAWREIPIDTVRDASNERITGWPLNLSNGSSPVIAWNMPLTPGVDQTNAKYEVRAVFSEPNGEPYPSEAVVATLDQDAPAPADAVEAIGPGSVDLLSGNFTLTRDDVSESGFNSSLTFNRSYNSRRRAAGGSAGPLGPHWTTSLPVDEAFSDYARLEVESFSFEEERMEFATVFTSDGSAFYFLYADGAYKPEPGSEDLALTRLSAGGFRIKDLENNETLFRQEGSEECYDEGYLRCVTRFVPEEIRQPGDSNTTTFDFDVLGDGKLRIKRIYAPGSSSACEAAPSPNCRWLGFGYSDTTYITSTGFGEYVGRLRSITLHTGSASDMLIVYSYDAQGRLRQATDYRGADPQDPNSFYLTEEYDYDAEDRLVSVKPPGETAWTLSYAAIPSDPLRVPAVPNDPSAGRLRSVTRPQPNSAPAQTTVLYDVPTTGFYAPYEMAPSRVADWGQQAVPTDVTAIFPPGPYVPSAPASQPPALFPQDYRWASVHYMDRKGREVNVSSPGGGASGHISTTEYDEHNNVVRELTPQNRLAALSAGDPAATAAQLDTRAQFSADGIELLHEWGPLHRVELADGRLVDARQHTAYTYDGFSELEYGTPPAHLLDTLTVSAQFVDENNQTVDGDERRSDYDYFDGGAEQGMKLRKPTTITADPGGLNLRTRASYNADGLVTSSSTPGASDDPDPRTTRMIYYTGAANEEDPDCGGRQEWKNLPCKVLPEAQPSTSGPPSPPKLPETKLEYDRFYRVTTKTETVRQSATDTKTRTTAVQYDKAGRVKRQSLTTSPEIAAERLSDVVNTYDPSTGLLATTTLAGGGPTITREYDALGRISRYWDGDMTPSSLTTTNYDGYGRVNSVAGPKGNQSYEYFDQAGQESGRLRHILDSGAGHFYAIAYDADGQLLEQRYPNDLISTTTYDSTGTATNLTYQKNSNVWLESDVTESIHGQWMRHRSTLSDQDFKYDQAGRLTEAKDTPHPGTTCTRRKYSYDGVAGTESNRTSLVTLTGVDSTCSSSATTTTNYGYDAANRLTGSGVEYDDFGRITRLPGTYADAGPSPQPLQTSYYANDLVREQTQDLARNGYGLDPIRRQRTREESQRPSASEPFVLSATETYRYGDDSDSPSWIEETPESGTPTWSRTIEGIGGDLVGIQRSDRPTEIQLTNLHGDVVGTCSADQSASSFTRTGEADEFGVPRQDDSPRFSWLGGKQRRTELKSGVVQMGVRSYVPKLGRFLQVDPVQGGSANTYDYAWQDPVNAFDLDGRACYTKATLTRIPSASPQISNDLVLRVAFKCTRNEKWVFNAAIYEQKCFAPPCDRGPLQSIRDDLVHDGPPKKPLVKPPYAKTGRGGYHVFKARYRCTAGLPYYGAHKLRYGKKGRRIDRKTKRVRC